TFPEETVVVGDHDAQHLASAVHATKIHTARPPFAGRSTRNRPIEAGHESYGAPYRLSSSRGWLAASAAATARARILNTAQPRFRRQAARAGRESSRSR